jgi:hypothetical protein
MLTQEDRRTVAVLREALLSTSTLFLQIIDFGFRA